MFYVKPDPENNAEEWWCALDEREPALSDILRSYDETLWIAVSADHLDRFRALPGWTSDDYPSHASTPLLVQTFEDDD